MPAIAALPQNQPAALVSYSYTNNNRWTDTPYSQGIEAKKVYAKAEEVFRHWRERTEVLLMPCKETDEFSYEHVPANRVFYVKTRYVYVGKGLPQPFDLDDE